MSISPKSIDTNLSDLLKEISVGVDQLPEFQRDWTWDDNRIRGIIASITQGYPMGAIMRLQYGNPDIRFKYRTIEGVGKLDTVPDYLILDGQQRMTSIYQAAYSDHFVTTKTDKGTKIERFYYLSMEKCLNENEDRVEAILSVPADRVIRTNFNRDVVSDYSTREKEFENKVFPLNIVFHSSLLTDWMMEYWTYYAGNQEATNIFKKFKAEVLDTITSYKLPVITLDKNTPREAVCKVFENVNTGGVPLTVFELVTATFATYEFDLRKDWSGCEKKDSCREQSTCKDRLSCKDWMGCKNVIRGTNDTLRTDLLDGIDETAFLTTVTLYTSYIDKQADKIGTVSCKKRDVLALNYHSYKDNRDQVLLGYQIAREFLLTYQCVFRMRDLPYTTQLIPLAAICAVLGKSKCSEPNTIKILSRWYWCGILGEMYGGANETRYANDIEDVIDEVYGRNNPARTVNASFFSATRLLTLQTRNSAAYKGIMALLYKAKCRDFMNDVTIDKVNSMVQSPDIHHIFPEAYSAREGIARQKYNCIVNKTPLLPETNRTLGGNAPSVYTKTILKKVGGLTEQELRSRIESHKVDYDALVSDDFDTYFIDRAKKILDLIEAAMEKPVADRGSEVTIKQFGVSLV